jgi:RNA polymerase primary sigma factor
MLARYADVDGAVSKLAHDGVARLHGLNADEVRELTSERAVRKVMSVSG